VATLARGVAAPRSLAHRLGTPRVAGYLLVLPAGIYVLALIGFPLVLGVWYSLTNTTVASPGRFIGLKNFVDVTRDPTFSLAVRNTLIIGVIATAAKITLSVALAFLMLGAFPGRGILRTLFVLPWTIPIALSTIAYKWMFHSQYSVINWILIQLGILDQGIQWLGTPIPAMGAVIFVSTWRAVPFGAITVLAGLTAIPSEIIEAARIDGAGWWAQLRNVTIPMMSPVIFYTLILAMVAVLQYFLVPLVLFNGTGEPGGETLFYNLYIFKTFFTFQQMSYGATLAWALFLVALLVTLILFRASRRFVYYAAER
jgi:multiple sugar transport system permease protein